MANNPDQEEAEDEVEVDYSGDQMEIGFNAKGLELIIQHFPTFSGGKAQGDTRGTK